jgi:hypothetical protein
MFASPRWLRTRAWCAWFDKDGTGGSLPAVQDEARRARAEAKVIINS